MESFAVSCFVNESKKMIKRTIVLIMKTFFVLLLFFWGIACSQQQEAPLDSIHEYTKTQKEVLKQWKQARQVQQTHGLSGTEIQGFMKDQLTGRFRQPLVRPQRSHGKRCEADHGCGFGFSCVQGICVGGTHPEKYGKCIRGPFAHLVCSNTGEECITHQDCILQ